MGKLDERAADEQETPGRATAERRAGGKPSSLVRRLGMASIAGVLAAQGVAACDSDGANSGDGGAAGDGAGAGSGDLGEAGAGGSASSGGGSGGTTGVGGGDAAGAAGMGGGCSDCCDPEDPPCEDDWELVCYGDWNVTHYCCNEAENTRDSCMNDGDFYHMEYDLCICDAVWPPVPF